MCQAPLLAFIPTAQIWISFSPSHEWIWRKEDWLSSVSSFFASLNTVSCHCLSFAISISILLTQRDLPFIFNIRNLPDLRQSHSCGQFVLTDCKSDDIKLRLQLLSQGSDFVSRSPPLSVLVFFLLFIQLPLKILLRSVSFEQISPELHPILFSAAARVQWLRFTLGW